MYKIVKVSKHLHIHLFSVTPFSTPSHSTITSPRTIYWQNITNNTDVDYTTLPKLILTGIPVLLTKYINKSLFAESLLYFFRSNGFTYIKIGQWLASRPDLLSIKVRQKLSNLHDEAPVHSTEYTNEVLRNEFPNLQLRITKHNVIGSGCVAQVYKSMINNKSVAIKILHPGVRERIEKDLNLIEKFTSLFISKSFFTQFKIDTRSQLDMNNEYKNLKILKSKNRYCKYLHIPDVYYNSSNVIIEEFVNGVKINDVKPNDRIVYKLLMITSKMIFKDRFFHADMHPGNILCAIDKIVLLDGGMCRYFFDREYKNLFDLLYEVMYNKDYDKACDLILTRTKNDHIKDVQGFKRSILRCVEEKRNVTEVFKILRYNNVNLDYGYSSLVMTLYCLDGVLKRMSDRPYKYAKNMLYLFAPAGYFIKRYIFGYLN